MPATSTPASAPKTMSSRLLTMKFMQRAAHASPASGPSTPDEPTPKRRRTDSASTPSRVNVDSLADRTAIQAALANEEAKRQAALEKQARDAGDTRWVLSFEDQKQAASSTLSLRIVSAGFANLDAIPRQITIVDDDLEDKPVMVGRRSFGKFNKVLEKQQDPAKEDEDSESDSENDDEDDNSESDSEADSDDPTRELIRSERKEASERAKAERKAKKRAAAVELERAAKKRRKNDVNLNGNRNDDGLAGLTSLSGRPAPTASPRGIPKDISCFNCGENHFKKDCPNSGGKRSYGGGGDDGPRRKNARKDRG